MTRSTAATVRWPGVRIAPTTNTWTQSHTRSLKTSSNTRRTRTMSLGRASMTHPFWLLGVSSRYPASLVLSTKWTKPSSAPSTSVPPRGDEPVSEAAGTRAADQDDRAHIRSFGGQAGQVRDDDLLVR